MRSPRPPRRSHRRRSRGHPGGGHPVVPPMITVALDGRGAERGPEAIVAGARAAAADGIRLRVFGDQAELAQLEGVDGTEVVAATAEITNAEEPVAAVRTRPEASV